MRPIADRAIVKICEPEKVSTGGIIIPDSAKEKPQKGEVVAVGAGKIYNNGQLIKPTIKTGDQVLFSKYAGAEIEINNEQYLIIKESEILAIV